jgi:predicted regulator of Ras-like GTPase activity (Roadblock/LC7/MglB family)
MSQPYGQDLNWLVTDFTTRIEDVAHAIVVSADGVPLAMSAGIPEDALEQFAAIISGLASLVQGAARIFEGGAPIQVLVEMEDGLMLVKAVSDGSSLAVLAAPECDTRQVSFDMTRLVGAVGELLTPAARAELQFCGHPPGRVPLQPHRALRAASTRRELPNQRPGMSFGTSQAAHGMLGRRRGHEDDDAGAGHRARPDDPA